MPVDPAVAILRADALDDQAGEARGTKSVRNATEQQLSEFHRLSGVAAEATRRAVALNPDDLLPVGDPDEHDVRAGRQAASSSRR